jgi:hypothetical protein
MVVAPGARERERRVRETAFVNNEYANAGQDAAIPSAAAASDEGGAGSHLGRAGRRDSPGAFLHPSQVTPCAQRSSGTTTSASPLPFRTAARRRHRRYAGTPASTTVSPRNARPGCVKSVLSTMAADAATKSTGVTG